MISGRRLSTPPYSVHLGERTSHRKSASRSCVADRRTRTVRDPLSSSAGGRTPSRLGRFGNPRDGSPRVRSIRRVTSVSRRYAIPAGVAGRVRRLLLAKGRPARGERRALVGRAEFLEHLGLRGGCARPDATARGGGEHDWAYLLGVL